MSQGAESDDYSNFVEKFTARVENYDFKNILNLVQLSEPADQEHLLCASLLDYLEFGFLKDIIKKQLSSREPFLRVDADRKPILTAVFDGKPSLELNIFNKLKKTMKSNQEHIFVMAAAQARISALFQKSKGKVPVRRHSYSPLLICKLAHFNECVFLLHLQVKTFARNAPKIKATGPCAFILYQRIKTATGKQMVRTIKVLYLPRPEKSDDPFDPRVIAAGEYFSIYSTNSVNCSC